MVASEESAIRAVMPDPDAVWTPKAGEPVIARVEGHGLADPRRPAPVARPTISCAVTGTEASCDTVEVSS